MVINYITNWLFKHDTQTNWKNNIFIYIEFIFYRINFQHCHIIRHWPNTSIYTGRKLTTPPNLLKATPFSRTSSSICLINNNNNNPQQTSSPLNTSGSSSTSSASKNSSLSVQHQLRRSVSSSSLTKIAALNRMQLLQQQQQQRNNTLGSTNRMTSGSSTNLSGSLFNNSLEVAHEEARLDIGQSFSSTSSNSIRT